MEMIIVNSPNSFSSSNSSNPGPRLETSFFSLSTKAVALTLELQRTPGMQMRRHLKQKWKHQQGRKKLDITIWPPEDLKTADKKRFPKLCPSHVLFRSVSWQTEKKQRKRNKTKMHSRGLFKHFQFPKRGFEEPRGVVKIVFHFQLLLERSGRRFINRRNKILFLEFLILLQGNGLPSLHNFGPWGDFYD